MLPGEDKPLFFYMGLVDEDDGVQVEQSSAFSLSLPVNTLTASSKPTLGTSLLVIKQLPSTKLFHFPLTLSPLFVKSKDHLRMLKDMLIWKIYKVFPTGHSLGNSCMRMSHSVQISATMSLCSASSQLPLQLFTIKCSSMSQDTFAGPAGGVFSIANLPLILCCLTPPHSSLLSVGNTRR